MMEKIKINEIVKKGVVCIVKYHDEGEFIKEATLNVNFNAKEISYLELDVGIGGTVSVEIKNKPKNPLNESEGFWVNITKVDMTSAVKNTAITESEKIVDTPQVQAGLMSVRDISIVSQCLTKCWAKTCIEPKTPEHMLEAYRFFVLELENNG